ncbi:unnamed protein product [Acanthoscelides obtectus]|uniref:Uncharacterized protein n=1 Tax=Acanthoscelides obtectus TaxID=200917 RepID=A0A9P0L795_ACAOB|nr:unnamed protein product [Acanthoscelides obtectus]CAK1640567.1 hypothetical protein AOBTE_LOCUS11806 [Acanthoscelides obtectus]
MALVSFSQVSSPVIRRGIAFVVQSEATFFRLSRFLPASARVAPRQANCFAVAAPMPELAPVINTTLPVQSEGLYYNARRLNFPPGAFPISAHFHEFSVSSTLNVAGSEAMQLLT